MRILFLCLFLLNVRAQSPLVTCWVYPGCTGGSFPGTQPPIQCPSPYANMGVCNTCTAGHYIINGGCLDCCVQTTGQECSTFCPQSGCLLDTGYTWLPTEVPSIDQCQDYRTCAEGYYAADTAIGETLQCSACLTTPTPLSSCPTGQNYLNSRCYYDKANVTCVDCTSPLLTQPGWEYGQAYNPPSCLLGTPMYQTGCVYYQTPDWDSPTCAVQCQEGYLNVGLIQLGTRPTCAACDQTCSPGFITPNCPRGSVMRSKPDEAKCQPCTNQLPAHANWTSGCDWVCDRGFYKGQQQQPQCVACVDTCNGTGVFIMCRGGYEGMCVVCDSTVRFIGQFYTAMPWDTTCSTATCSIATLGVTWRKKSCSKFSNTVLSHCTQVCGVGTYKTANCSTTQDQTCAPCTAPADGQIYLTNCTQTSDASFGACPISLACYGGRAIPCSPPLIPDANGLCVCPPATTLALTGSSLCVPIVCPQGTFPDPMVSGCSACSAPGTAGSVTTPGIMGREACSCSSGYFLQHSPTTRCWPCGNLQCDPNTQLQMACPGGYCASEPSCECQIPAGSIVTPYYTGTCTFACDDSSYSPTPQASFVSRMWQGKPTTFCPTFCPTFYIFNNLALFSEAGGPLYAAQYSVITPISKPIVHAYDGDRVLPLGNDLIIYTVDNRELWYVFRNSSTSLWLNTQMPILDLTFLNHNVSTLEMAREGNLVSIHILHHDPPDIVPSHGGFWLLFVYNTTSCNGLTSVLPTIPCTFMERFVFATLDQLPNYDQYKPFDTVCVLQRCLYYMNNWGGSVFAFDGDSRWTSVTSTNSLTILVTQQNSPVEYLYWGAQTLGGSFVLAQYTAYIYTVMPTTLISDVPLVYPSQTACPITSIAFAMSTLYAHATGCSGIMMWSIDMKNNGGLTSAGVMLSSDMRLPLLHQVMSLYDIIPLAANGLYSTLVSGQLGFGLNVLGAIAEDTNGLAYILTIDLLNMYSWAEQPRGIVMATTFTGTSSSVSAVFNQNGTLSIATGVQLCGVDQVSYDQISCQPVHCYLSNPIGPNSVRVLHTPKTGCVAGYYGTSTCTQCPVGSYCPALISAAVRCSTTMTTTSVGGTSLDDCVCKPGFFSYAGSTNRECLPCDKGFWCRGGSNAPIACFGGASTSDLMSVDPLYCQCQTRTSGLTCQTCPVSSTCFPQKGNTPTVIALYATGWGNRNADLSLQQCLSVYVDSIVYQLYGSNVAVQYTAAALIIDQLQWEWEMVIQLPPQSSNVMDAIRLCMMSSAFSFTALNEVRRVTANTVGSYFTINQEIPCGAYQEVDSSGLCNCIAGFERLLASGISTCVPCQIGNVRASGTIRTDCTPCADNTTQYAPNMGMSGCICRPGYYLPLTNPKACVAIASGNDIIGFFRDSMHISVVVSGAALLLAGFWFAVSLCLL